MIRRGLRFTDWPEPDQKAWTAATARGHRFRRGPAAHWAPTTLAVVQSAYGRWLGYLAEAEPAAFAECALDRVTEERLVRYVDHLAETAGSMGQHMYVEKLREAIRVMFPGLTPEHLTLIGAQLAGERRPRSKAASIIATPRLIKLGVSLMDGAVDPANDIADPIEYRDGLMIGLLACRPLRRRTYQLIHCGAHLQQADEDWQMVFDGSEVKSKRSLRTTVPQRLVPYLEVYLQRVRPMFPGAEGHNGLWASRSGIPLTAMAITDIISDRTRAAFGHPVSPHLFRHCAATTIAMVAPERVGIARNLLGHAALSTTDANYIRAESLYASKVYATVIAGELAAARALLRKGRQRGGHLRIGR